MAEIGTFFPAAEALLLQDARDKMEKLRNFMGF